MEVQQFTSVSLQIPPQVMMQAQADRVYLALPALLSPAHQLSPGEVVQYFLLQSVSG